MKIVSITAITSLLSLPVFAQCSVPPSTASENADVVGLVAAIRAAQGPSGGGVLEAELEIKDGQLVYEIDLVRDNELHETFVNAQTGNIVGTKQHPLTGLWSRVFRDDKLSAAKSASGTLLQALETAERESRGKASELSLDRENGRWLYEVELDGAQGDREIMIEPATGRVMAAIDD